MKKILAIVFALAACGQVHAQSTLPQVQTVINNSIRANGTGAITGTILNSVLNLMAVSTPTMIGSIGGDCSGTLPTLICTKTNGVSFGALATSTDASNLTGSVPVAALSNVINAIGYVPGNIAAPLSQFASTTSVQLQNVISDETGTGSLVFSASPTFTGVPLSTTAAVDTNSFQIATTGFVIGQNYLKKSGGTLTGNLILNADPSTALGAVTKQYADALAAGIFVHTPARVKTTANLTATYNNGAGTLTNSGALAAISIDSVALSLNDRVLVNNQTNTFENGIYSVTTVGSGAVAWVLTRATDFNTVAAGNVATGAYVLVTSGSTFTNSSWVFTFTGAITIGVSNLTFGQYGSSVTGYAPIASPVFTGLATSPAFSAVGSATHAYDAIGTYTTILDALAATATNGIAVQNNVNTIVQTDNVGNVRSLFKLDNSNVLQIGYSGGTTTLNGLTFPEGNIATNLGSPSRQWGTIYSYNMTLTNSLDLTGTFTGNKTAQFYANPMTINFGPLDNSGYRNIGIGPTCNVNSVSYKGELFCLYSSLVVDSIAATSAAGDNQFTANHNFVNGQGNVTSANAGVFAGNDNIAVVGTGWAYAVGREIDVTVYQPVSNKQAIRIVQGYPDAYQGSSQDGAIVAVNQAGPGGLVPVGWKNLILLDATSGNIPVLNPANGCVICVNGSASIYHGVNLEAWSFTGYPFKSPGFSVDGNGIVIAAEIRSNTNFIAAGQGGVDCSGPPTVSFAVKGGIVTHC